MLSRATVLLLMMLPGAGRAECGCLWQGSFADVQGAAELVVASRVLSRKGNSVDMAVEALLRGSEHLPTIRVWMNPGGLCRPEAEEFAPGSQWVMALHRIGQRKPGDFNPNTPNISAGRVGDYSLSLCGGYWLSHSDGLVSGNLVGGVRWERQPKMSPVPLALVDAYVNGRVDHQALRGAAELDPALRRLQFETRLFLRRERRRNAIDVAAPE